MKVLVAAAQFSTGISGLQRHALMLIRCLLQQPEIQQVHVALAPWQERLLREVCLNSKDRVVVHVAQMNRGAFGRNEWHYRHLPILAARIQPDIVHLTYPVPLDRKSLGISAVVTLHDLYPYDIPENFGFPKRLFNRIMLRQCLRNADAIACVSDATLGRMKEHMPREYWNKATRIHNCVEAISVGPIDELASQAPLPALEGNPFLLSVAQHRNNKNIPLLIETFQRLLKRGALAPATRLLVVGITGPETPLIRRTISRLKLAERVQLVEGLTDAELQWCYRNCELLIAPSRIEGFGLPVAEALLAGCPVICSDIPAFREIDETHCHFIELDSDATENLACGVAHILRSPRPAPIALPKFSAQGIGAQYVRIYQQLQHANETSARVRHLPHAQLAHGTVAPFYRKSGEEKDGL